MASRTPPVPDRREGRTRKGRKAHSEGHAAEWTAAAWLMLKGYQILGFRLKTRHGELDILARKRSVLAAVEVKRRATLAAAIEALGPVQHGRLVRAATAVRKSRPGLRALTLRLDLIALAPGRLPRHIRGLAAETDLDDRYRL
ncbi:YraN family protein [Brevundimonas sp.]|uniref:YraN family protein n=1 Tax=Brevundimonas sp. TaxID=1871086 RepID=UPI003AF5F1F5